MNDPSCTTPGTDPRPSLKKEPSSASTTCMASLQDVKSLPTVTENPPTSTHSTQNRVSKEPKHSRSKGDMGGTAMKGKKAHEDTMEESENVRRWFTNLPSGQDRACAAAITDAAFIQLYLHMAKKYSKTTQSNLQSLCCDTGIVPGDGSEGTISNKPGNTTSKDLDKKFSSFSENLLESAHTRSDISRMYDQYHRQLASSASKSTSTTASEASTRKNFGGTKKSTIVVHSSPKSKNRKKQSRQSMSCENTNKTSRSPNDRLNEKQEHKVQAMVDQNEKVHRSVSFSDVTQKCDKEGDVFFDTNSCTSEVLLTEQTTENKVLNQESLRSCSDAKPMDDKVSPGEKKNTIDNEEEITMSLHFDTGETIPIIKTKVMAQGMVEDGKSKTEEILDSLSSLPVEKKDTGKCSTSSPEFSESTEVTESSSDNLNNTEIAKREVVESKIMASRALSSRTETSNQKSIHQDDDILSTSNASVNARESSNEQERNVSNTTYRESDALSSFVHVESSDKLNALRSLNDLHKQIRLVNSSHGNLFIDDKGKTNEAKEKQTELPFDLLILDPSLLDRENGDIFLKIASRIIQHQQQRRRGFGAGFLSTPPPKRNRDTIMKGHVKMNILPNWLKGSSESFFSHHSSGRKNASTEEKGDGTKSKIPFHLILLARIEMSIWGSYYRHTQSLRQGNSSHSTQDKSDVISPLFSSPVDVKGKLSSSHLSNLNELLMCTLKKAKNYHSHGLEIGLHQRHKLLEPVIERFGLKDYHMLHNCSNEMNGVLLDENFQLDYILLTPLAWLINGPDCDDDNGDYYETLKNALIEVEDSLSHRTEQGPDSSPPLTSEPDINEPAPNVSESNTNTSKQSKNKKKKKKKKKRKSSNASSHGLDKQFSQASITNPVPQVTATVTTSDADKNSNDRRAGLPPIPPKQNLDKAVFKETNSDSGIDSKEYVSKSSNTSGITVQRVEGTGTTCIVVDKPNASSNSTPADETSAQTEESTWEKVEARGRGGRGKNINRFPSFNSVTSTDSTAVSGDVSIVTGGTNSGKNSKSKSGKTAASRRRLAHRKICREILFSILDNADAEINSRRKQAMKALNEERKRKNDEKRAAARTQQQQGRPEKLRQVPSLRDIVAGTIGVSQTPVKDLVGDGNQFSKKSDPSSSISASSNAVSSATCNANVKPVRKVDGNSNDKNVNDSRKQKYVLATKKQNLSGADQGTAPTLPETLSGVSAASNSNTEIGVFDEFSQGGASSGSSDGINLPETNDPHKPPLPTLLSGPGTTNSTTSSVASSLEAPHASGQISRGKEKDVGYHLLNVCERLSNDMATFMARRSLALSVRRSERGSLLAALQDTLTKIWAGRCHVEMYGSCATQLDLPSSDLDVVICGLPSPKPPKKNKKHGNGDGSHGQHLVDHHSHHAINAGRVQRLAGELEHQPWAVQVKAIPTATVPVIKILADPARLPGATASGSASGHEIGQMSAGEWIPASGEWMIPAGISQHMAIPQPMIPQTSNMSQHFISSTPVNTAASTGIASGSMMNPFPAPWRGADVMNGLIKLDITFEGPEHGGVGSTAYAARIVQEACNETGLPPEATPVVQLTMVLKELLAQRRLNEPFSGGLSSYALLLMVVAIMRERKAIRAEMELAERQRKAVAASSSAPPRPNTSSQSQMECTNESSVRETNTATVAKKSSSFSDKRNASSCSITSDNISYSAAVTSAAVSETTSSTSSWASIAKKSNAKLGNETKTNRLNNEKIVSVSQQQNHITGNVRNAGSNNEKSNVVAEKSGKRSNRLASNTAKKSCDARLKVASTTQQNDTHDGLNTASSSNSTLNMSNNSQQVTSSQVPSTGVTASSSFGCNQGSDDILEVMCSGDPTAGKLLMHFLLFYGRYFDSLNMSIDVTAPEDGRGPFVQRKAGGSIDPITGMFTVDPIVVYDPLEGAERNNVARSCFAWQSIRWVFGQCFTTLTNTVEHRGRGGVAGVVDDGSDISHLLELLLSY